MGARVFVILGVVVVMLIIVAAAWKYHKSHDNTKEGFSEVVGGLRPFAKEYGKCKDECQYKDHRFTLGVPWTLKCYQKCNDTYSEAVKTYNQDLFYKTGMDVSGKPVKHGGHITPVEERVQPIVTSHEGCVAKMSADSTGNSLALKKYARVLSVDDEPYVSDESIKHDIAVKDCTCETEVYKYCKQQCMAIDGTTDEGCVPACQVVYNVNCTNPGGWQRPLSQ
jgi:hypothetical protein